MQCPSCQQSFPDGTLYCPHDGSALEATTDAALIDPTGDTFTPALAKTTPSPVERATSDCHELDDDAIADPMLDSVLDGRYRVHGKLGEGGMGVVYRAHQDAVGRDVAIKVLSREASMKRSLVKRFENEAKIISQLRHPSTLKLIDFGRAPDGRLFIVTEFLEGRTLEAEIARSRLSPERTLHIIGAICDSLSEAHGRGIIHRDLKPGNVLLEELDHVDLVKVLDFGIAKLGQQPTNTATGTVFGTPFYMSPEQASGSAADHRSDLYSLGVVAYECLCGAPPFTGEAPVALLVQHVNAQPPPLLERAPNIPEPLAELVMQLLEKSPDDRVQSVRELRTRIDTILGHKPRPSSGAGVPRVPMADNDVTPVEPERSVAPLATDADVLSKPLAAPPRGSAWLAISLVIALVSGAAWYGYRANTATGGAAGSTKPEPTTMKALGSDGQADPVLAPSPALTPMPSRAKSTGVTQPPVKEPPPAAAAPEPKPAELPAETASPAAPAKRQANAG